LSGSVAGYIVDSVLYNSLGMISEINLHNGVTTTYGYWGIDETGGYYGRLWNINTNDGVDDLIDIEYTWDAAGNLLTREDVIAQETESFTYDFLDRLTGVSGPYSESYTYDEIGNITSRNGVDYNYDSTQPHAVDSIDGFNSYTYDANGNMITRGSQTLAWDAENRVTAISDNGTIATFVYDGNGSRVMKTENGETILYVNQYYKKNLTTGEVTTYYYLGGQLVAMRQGTELKYMHQDHLTSTSVMTDESGDSLGAIEYLPFGETRSGSVPTDKQFTGQELDGTGLYYYGARYYDPTIGRFISADTIIPNPANPQAFNRYTYCLNNPLKYVDPTGYWGEALGKAPETNGSLGYTSEEGWLISIDGEWYPISDEAADIMFDVWEESGLNWDEFMEGFGVPDISEDGLPMWTWGYNTAGEDYIWYVTFEYDRDMDISGEWPYEPQFTLVEIDINIDWQRVGEVILGSIEMLAGGILCVIGGGIGLVSFTAAPVTLGSGTILGEWTAGFIISIGGMLINEGIEMVEEDEVIGPIPPYMGH
jgi:RHS repeat-associated protein